MGENPGIINKEKNDKTTKKSMSNKMGEVYDGTIKEKRIYVAGNKNETKYKKKVKKQNLKTFWPIKVFIIAFALSLCFSILSEFLLGRTGVAIALIIIVVFVAIAIITDMIGVAVTACSKEPFIAMASKKVRGAKEGLSLIKNADKVASLCADVIGDVCGILSGAAGASIVIKFANDLKNDSLTILVASLVTALIAGTTIFGKALGKRYAINNCNSIILRVGKLFSLFNRNTSKK
ncbi:MAG: hypothetical protein J6T74_06395 [Clostridia bacterium]|nr:hypothetical protein [Clostridia bacterium]